MEQDLLVLSELGQELVVVLSSKPRVLCKLLDAEVTESTDAESRNNIAFTIADDPKEDTEGRLIPAEAGSLASLFCWTRSSCCKWS